jgi:hypothetical protein
MLLNLALPRAVRHASPDQVHFRLDQGTSQMEQTMRYVFYAAAAVAIAALWLNTSTQGSRLKRQMSDHPAETASLY